MDEKVKPISIKSQILLQIIFVFTLAVALFFLLKDGFTDGLNPLIIWFYFGVTVIYEGLAIFDLIKFKEKSKGLKIFILIMLILSIVSSILYATFYLIALGK